MLFISFFNWEMDKNKVSVEFLLTFISDWKILNDEKYWKNRKSKDIFQWKKEEKLIMF